MVDLSPIHWAAVTVTTHHLAGPDSAVTAGRLGWAGQFRLDRAEGDQVTGSRQQQCETG